MREMMIPCGRHEGVSAKIVVMRQKIVQTVTTLNAIGPEFVPEFCRPMRNGCLRQSISILCLFHSSSFFCSH